MKRIASHAIGMIGVLTLTFVGSIDATAGTLDQIKQTNRLRIGYRSDARPSLVQGRIRKRGRVSVALCQQIADAIKTDLGLSQMTVEWIPVTIEGRYRAVQQGQVDLLCGAETATLARRTDVSFSLPIFPGGIGALMRADAPARLREVLAGRQGPVRPVWRGTIDPAVQARTFSVVTGTTAEPWLAAKLDEFQITAHVAPVQAYDAGVQRVLDRGSDVLFGDRALLLDAAKRSASARDLIVLDRQFTYEPLAVVLPRGDEDLRLVVDRTLSHLYKSGQAAALYAKWCGEPESSTLTFFQMNALPD